MPPGGSDGLSLSAVALKNSLQRLRSDFDKCAKDGCRLTCFLVHADASCRETCANFQVANIPDSGVDYIDYPETGPEPRARRAVALRTRREDGLIFPELATEAGRLVNALPDSIKSQLNPATVATVDDQARWMWTVIDLAWLQIPGSGLWATRQYADGNGNWRPWAPADSSFCSGISNFFRDSVAALDLILAMLAGTHEQAHGASDKPLNVAAGGSVEPAVYLQSWAEIAVTAGMSPNEYLKIKRLNEKFDGPIPPVPKGSQPRVRKDAFIEWWNGLAILQQEQAHRRTGARLTAEAHHNYGRGGVAAPEIGGSVRQRRRDKHPEGRKRS
jgi:hypothetical protein